MQLGVGKADIPSADLPSHCVPHPFSCFALHRGKPPIANAIGVLRSRRSAFARKEVKQEKRNNAVCAPPGLLTALTSCNSQEVSKNERGRAYECNLESGKLTSRRQTCQAIACHTRFRASHYTAASRRLQLQSAYTEADVRLSQEKK